METKTKILLVEDEYIVRQGIIKTVDWESIGCEVIGEASDGGEAVEMIKTLSPDIIITDICMKEMDGIKMLKRLKEEEQDVKAIILSGYTDFEYAKNAMELGVRHYLLKPIENEKLIEAIISVKTDIKKEKKLLNRITRQQIALRKLLEEEDTAGLIETMGISVPDERFLVANIRIEKGYEEGNNVSLKYTTELLECVDYFSGIDIHYTISILVGERNVVMIIFERNGKMSEGEILNNIREHFGMKTGKRLTIGVSRVDSDIRCIHELYKQSCIALNNKNSFETNTIIYYDDVKMLEGRFEPIFSEEEKAEVLDAIEVNAIEKVEKILRSAFERLGKYTKSDIESIKDTVIELAVIMVKQSAKNLEEMQLIFGRKIQPAIEISQLDNVDAIEKWFDVAAHAKCQNFTHKMKKAEN